MRICLITDTWRQINGVSTTLKNTVHILQQQGHEVLVINPDMFKTISMPGYREVQISVNVWKIFSMISDFSPNAIHIATEGPLGVAGMLYCRWKKLPFNSSYHTKFPEYLKQRFGIPLSISYFLLRKFHGKSKKVLVTSESMKKELSDRGFANLVVWGRGADSEIFSPQRGDPDFKKNIYKKISHGPLILCVSRLSMEKNLDAFCQIKTSGILLLVGDGPEGKRLQEQYPHVFFTGYKTGKELARYYASADVFVFPSLTDTFGVVMIEALACGTPVVAYPVTGPIDIVENGVTGYLSNNLQTAIGPAMMLDRNTVYLHGKKWNWNNATKVFFDNLTPLYN